MSAAKKEFTAQERNPLPSLDQWEEAVLERYPEPGVPANPRIRANSGGGAEQPGECVHGARGDGGGAGGVPGGAAGAAVVRGGA